MLQTLMDWLNNALGWVFGFLPDSPFQGMLSNTPVEDYLGYVAYFIDVSFIVNAFLVWLSAVAAYYIVMAVLRWVKAIGNS